MQVSIGIATYNRPKHFSRLLSSLSSQTENAEQLVIVDDSDNDKSKEIVEEFRNQFCAQMDFTYISRCGDTKLSEARNLILNEAKGEILAYLDDDTKCPESWIESLREAHSNFPNAAALGGPAIVVDEEGSPKYNPLLTAVNQNWINKYGEQGSKEGVWKPPHPVETDQLSGANMSFKTDVLSKIEGFNTIYRGSEMYEDTDVMARLCQRDQMIIYHPDLAVKHFETQKMGTTNNRDYWYWLGWNSIVFRYERFPKHFWWSLVRLFLYNRSWRNGPLWKQIGASILKTQPGIEGVFKGYVDGFVFVCKRRISIRKK